MSYSHVFQGMQGQIDEGIEGVRNFNKEQKLTIFLFGASCLFSCDVTSGLLFLSLKISGNEPIRPFMLGG